MQAKYPKTCPARQWDNLNLEYPVRKFPSTGDSSETIGRQWRNLPEILKDTRSTVELTNTQTKDFNVTKELTRSQTSDDFGFKLPDTKRHNKHNSCTENEYIYPLLRRVSERPPACHIHGTTEMRSAYLVPSVAPRLVANKKQHSMPLLYEYQEPSFHKELPPLDTTYEGFEKYLDPYLTTSRLDFRPYTADQLKRPSNTKDILTYYTFADIPWTRTPGPKAEQLQIPLSKAKPIYDIEQFKQGYREIRVHNKPHWVPGSFRTESRDNYKQQNSQTESPLSDLQHQVSTYFTDQTSKMSLAHPMEQKSIQNTYFTENDHYGSGKAISTVIDQYTEKNKRLERMLSCT